MLIARPKMYDKLTNFDLKDLPSGLWRTTSHLPAASPLVRSWTFFSQRGGSFGARIANGFVGPKWNYLLVHNPEKMRFWGLLSHLKQNTTKYILFVLQRKNFYKNHLRWFIYQNKAYIFVFEHQYYIFHPNNVDLSMHFSSQNYLVISNISHRFLTSQGR